MCDRLVAHDRGASNSTTVEAGQAVDLAVDLNGKRPPGHQPVATAPSDLRFLTSSSGMIEGQRSIYLDHWCGRGLVWARNHQLSIHFTPSTQGKKVEGKHSMKKGIKDEKGTSEESNCPALAHSHWNWNWKTTRWIHSFSGGHEP